VTSWREWEIENGQEFGASYRELGFGLVRFGSDVAVGAAAFAAQLMMMMTNKTMESKRLMAFVCKMNECGNVSCFHLQRHLLW